MEIFDSFLIAAIFRLIAIIFLLKNFVKALTKHRNPFNAAVADGFLWSHVVLGSLSPFHLSFEINTLVLIVTNLLIIPSMYSKRRKNPRLKLWEPEIERDKKKE